MYYAQGDEKFVQNFSQNLKEKYHLGELGVNGRKMLKLILKKQHMKLLTGFICLG